MIPNLAPNQLRRNVLHFAFHGKSVHIPCAFSLIEVVSTLYSKFLRYIPSNPRGESRDYLVLSKGHGVMALYACFLEIGWLTESDMRNYFANGSRLRGLSEADIPGLEATCGSLGHGLPVAVGMALALKIKKSSQKVFCIAGDGEMNEGSMWESLLFAAHHTLDNLYLIVDANQFQAMGRTKEVLNMDPFVDKLQSFGFETVECDGHSMRELEDSMRRLVSAVGRPKALVANTVKGKGVSFMEANNTWHYTRLDSETYSAALRELC